MSWLRLDDGFDNDPAIVGIARTRVEADRFLGIIAALMLYCARHRTDGFVPALIVREHLRSTRLLQLLTDPPTGPGLLHPPGADCECLGGRMWPATGDFYVHHYLQFNPTRDEYDLASAKRAELRDRELHTAIRRRDHDHCRYCNVATSHADRRSSRGLVFDHVDPAIAAGAANLVVACRQCNSVKGNRTPAAAGMTLLPPWLQPTPDDSSWSARSSLGEDGTSRPVPVEAPTSWQTNDTTNNTTSDIASDPTTDASPVRDGTGRAPDLSQPDAGPAGPGGHRDPIGPVPPRPSSQHPDPYRRTAITGPDPADHAGLPPPDHPP